MCSVDKTGCEAIITQRALVFLSAVASRFRSCGRSAENFVVMLLNDAFHVIHTAVANFNCVFVENFVVPILNKEQHEKLLRDSITTTYKKADESSTRKIDFEAKRIATELGIADKNRTHRKTTGFHHAQRSQRKLQQ